MGIQGDRVRFNVGGRKFETSATTLANAGRDSYFGSLLDRNWSLQMEANSDIFIDRNPDCFAVLLDLLRTGELYIPTNVPEKSLYREALLYSILDQVRDARWGQFDGNRLRYSRSVCGQAHGDRTVIRASQDGGCCVVYGSMVHVYDWMLEEHQPINLDFQRVNDVGWIDSENIVVTACERPGTRDGGMGQFSPWTGELRYKFNVSHEDQIKNYTAGALAFSSDNKIFSSCQGGGNECGIGVWDENTGKQIDFFYESPGWQLGNAGRLQWLSGYNCLLVATLFPREGNCNINLLDFRQKDMVWNWSDVGRSTTSYEKRVRDAIAMEEKNSVCVVDEYDDLGFMDLRWAASSMRWSSRNQPMNGKMFGESCNPKLALHDGQLFSSMRDCISVFSGPDCVITSRLRRSNGGPIRDFSIGGDRLFALHREDNVFDIWEIPTRSII